MLLDQPVVNILHPTQIISFTKDASVKLALRVLSEHNILSAPVYDKEGGKCIGLVDVLDIVTFTIQMYYANDPQTSLFKNYILQFSFDVETVSAVLDISHKNPYIPTRDTTSIRDVLQKFSQGIHRVPIVDENDRVVFILSQMFLFRYFFKKHTEQYEQLKSKTISELNLGTRGDKHSMFAVRENQLAIDAFKQIADNGISAVGILDANDKKLIGVLSASDLQGLLDEDFFVLGQTVLQFKHFSLEKKRKRGIEEPARDPVVFCKLNSTLEEVVNRIEANQVHRIFIMDDDMQMLGVISLTDLFKLIYENL